MSEALKPCPFCGGEARCYQSDAFSEGGSFEFVVQCSSVGNHTLVNDYQTEAEAIAAWNARAEQTCEMAVCGWENDLLQCQSCGEYWELAHIGDPNYCPNCGARVVVA